MLSLVSKETVLTLLYLDIHLFKMDSTSPHGRESGFRNLPKFWPVESGILGFGIRNPVPHMWNRIHSVESRIHDCLITFHGGKINTFTSPADDI